MNQDISGNIITKIVLFLFSILLLIPLHFIVHSPLGLYGAVGVLGIALCYLAIFNFRITYYLMLLIIFLPHFAGVHEVTFFAFFVLFSLIINYTGNLIHEFKSQISFSVLIYFVLTLPSLINSSSPLLSLRDMLNIVAMIIVYFATTIGFTSRASMIKVFYFFISGVFIHSVIVIYLGIITGMRAFGLLGVYYIDLSGLAIVVSFILLLYSVGIRKYIFLVIFAVNTLGLVITQTRNALISFAVALFTLILYLIYKRNSIDVKIGRLIMIILGIVLVLGISYSSINFVANSTLEQRINLESTQITPTSDPESIEGHSLITRLLIWHTAAIAFLEHPILGIGTYSFKHTSSNYYKIPKKLFQTFVYGRTPHVTYLQVLVETGIIGLLGFLFFIITIIRQIIKSLSAIKTKEEILITLIISWSFVYIIFSMLMTESWLYGQYAVWIGILLGFLVNNSKLLKKNNGPLINAYR